MKKKQVSLPLFAVLIGYLFLGLFQANAEGLDDLASRLMALREEIEQNAQDLEQQKNQYRSLVDSLQAQTTDIDANVKRLQLQIHTLDQKLVQAQQELTAQSGDEKDYAPFIHQALDQLEHFMKNSLPFKIPERLEQVQNIKKQLSSHTITPFKAFSLYWSFLEDELRLTKENSLHQGVITIDKKDRLVTLAKVGMVFLFFKTEDELFGQAVFDHNQWSFQVEKDRKAQMMIQKLMGDLKKQIRQGEFDIPIRTKIGQSKSNDVVRS